MAAERPLGGDIPAVALEPLDSSITAATFRAESDSIVGERPAPKHGERIPTERPSAPQLNFSTFQQLTRVPGGLGDAQVLPPPPTAEPARPERPAPSREVTYPSKSAFQIQSDPRLIAPLALLLLMVSFIVTAEVDAQGTQNGTQGTEEAKKSDWARRQKRHKRLSGVSGSRKITLSPKKVKTGIDSGLVVAYGHLIRPPFSVEWQGETLSVNGVQVSPSIVLERSRSGAVSAASEKDRREFQQRADLVGEARKIYSAGEGKRRIEDIKADINALFQRAPVLFTDIRWTDDRHLLAQEVGAPITRSITFSAPEAREAAESQRTSRRNAAKMASAATIETRLRMNEVVIFDSSGGRSGGSTVEFVERVQRIMSAPDKIDEERIEELKEKVFGNYEPAFDVVENYDRAEWASPK